MTRGQVHSVLLSVQHQQNKCHNVQSEIDVFEIDGVKIDIDTYLEETEGLIEDMKAEQSHSHNCGCTTDTTTAQMNSLSTHDDKQKEGVPDNKSDTLPSRCGQSDKEEDSEQCFSYLKDKHIFYILFQKYFVHYFFS